MTETSDAAFLVEYIEVLARVPRRFILSYYAKDKSVSLYDISLKRMFLKRTVPPENVEFSNLYLGATVVILSRPLTILDYADEPTRRKLGQTRGSAVVLVKPHAYSHSGKILQMLYNAGFSVGRIRMVKFSTEDAETFLTLQNTQDHSKTIQEGNRITGNTQKVSSWPEDNSNNHQKNNSIDTELLNSMSKDYMLAVEVAGDDIIAKVHEAVGPADPIIAKEAAPNSIRAIFGRTKALNAVYASPSMNVARAEVGFLFDRSFPYTAICTHCSAVVIKPRAVESKLVGKIMDHMLANEFEITAVRTIALTHGDAADFLEVYRGVTDEYERWVNELSSGPCVILEVRGENIVDKVRELAGPYDVTVARALRPNCLRAVYGVDNVKNVMQVTDLPRDGPLECKFLFHVL